MKIMHQSLLLVASMLIANTAFCPQGGSSIVPVNEITIPDNVSITKQNTIGSVIGIGGSFIPMVPGSNSLVTIGVGLGSAFGATYFRLKGNSYYDRARTMVTPDVEEEKKSYVLWGNGIHFLGYLCSGIAACSLIKCLVNTPQMKNPIQTIDTKSSGIFKAITLGKMDKTFCQKYHIGTGALFVGYHTVAGIVGDKAADTKIGKEMGKKVKKFARIEDLN